MKSSLPFASRNVRNRIPHIANATPKAPPIDASSTLSVKSWRITRNRPAPMLSRTAISRLRAAALASSRFAMLAHAIARISPTMASNTYKGFEYCRRSVLSPVAPSRISSSGSVARSRSLAVRGDPLVKHRAQCGLRLREAYARTQARHHFEPIVVLLEIAFGIPSALLSAAAGGWCAAEHRNRATAAGSTPKNPGGATPATVNGMLLIRMDWPGALAASPKRL